MSVNLATRLPQQSRTEEWTRRYFLWILPSVLQDLHQCLLSIHDDKRTTSATKKYMEDGVWHASLNIGTHCRRCSRTRPSICTRCTVCADPRFGSCHWCSFALLLLDILGQCTHVLGFFIQLSNFQVREWRQVTFLPCPLFLGGPCCHHPRVVASCCGPCNRSAFNKRPCHVERREDSVR